MPVVYWLSGLTCTDENFHQKSGFARAASELGLCVVMPDTPPPEPTGTPHSCHTRIVPATRLNRRPGGAFSPRRQPQTVLSGHALPRGRPHRPNAPRSPRGVTIEGAEDGWDFGSGAGFYVDATEPKYKVV